MTEEAVLAPSRRRLDVSLWIAQVLLAVLFGAAGFMKAFMPLADLASMGMAFVSDVPEGLTRFIGWAELAGAIGIVVPAATRILPVLTVLAALGFSLIQIFAIGFHTLRGELATTWPANLVLLCLSIFVVWGRLDKVPIRRRKP